MKMCCVCVCVCLCVFVCWSECQRQILRKSQRQARSIKVIQLSAIVFSPAVKQTSMNATPVNINRFSSAEVLNA